MCVCVFSYGGGKELASASVRPLLTDPIASELCVEQINVRVTIEVAPTISTSHSLSSLVGGFAVFFGQLQLSTFPDDFSLQALWV